jgi:hypothetical protein
MRKIKISAPSSHHFCKYKYLRLLIGLKCSPDIAQAIMKNVPFSIEDADVYINDVGAFSND